jgi:thioredoxin reductase
VTRDGITPDEFRRIGRQQLEPYTSVEVLDRRVQEITGERGAFNVQLDGHVVVGARRILLCTGMIDEPPAIEGVRELWGTSIFQCPYCHGWEVQDQRFAYLAANAEAMAFAVFLRGWTSDVVALTNGAFTVPPEVRANLTNGGVHIEERGIARLIANDNRLAGIELTDGGWLARDALFVHPVQHQVDVVRALGLTLDGKGYVQVDEMTRETSMPGIYAAGDLLTPGQSAILSAAAGTRAAGMVNHALTLEMATAGAFASR